VSLLCAVFTLTAACSVSVSAKPDVNLRKPPQATVLVLGELRSDQPGWVAIQPEFRKTFLKYLIDREVFATIVDGSPRPDGALVLVGRLSEVEEGDTVMAGRGALLLPVHLQVPLVLALRAGAAKAHLKGRFEVRDASNITLLRFETHGATYAGGSSGDVQAMMHGFAVNVAHTVRRWSQGDLPE
jgi:hypothetical protein